MSKDPIKKIERKWARFMPLVKTVLNIGLAVLIGYVAFIQLEIFGVAGAKRWIGAIGIGLVGAYIFRVVLGAITFSNIKR